MSDTVQNKFYKHILVIILNPKYQISIKQFTDENSGGWTGEIF
jgi:hypothetical protein